MAFPLPITPQPSSGSGQARNLHYPSPQGRRTRRLGSLLPSRSWMRGDDASEPLARMTGGAA